MAQMNELMHFAQCHHIIDKFAEMIQNFHDRFVRSQKENQTMEKNTSHEMNSAEFDVKQSKLRKNKLILDINFFFGQGFDRNKWIDISDTIISNGFLES
jgi:hypothetical protein